MEKSSAYAWCNHTGCPKKEDCVRFSEENGTHYIRFETLMKDGECTWFVKNNREVVPVKETEEIKPEEPIEETRGDDNDM